MDIKNAFDHWSDTYDTDNDLTRDLDANVNRSMLAEQRFDSVLELGCGTGKNTVFLAQIGKYIHGLDFSKGMIQKAMEKVKVENVRFEAADLSEP